MFNRSTLSPQDKHNHLLRIYEQIRGHCDNFKIIYQYLLVGECSPEIIEDIYQTTEQLSAQGHENLLKTKNNRLQSILDQIHNQEAQEKESADEILLAINEI